ncbi:MAG: VWA domain-containing protein [Pirellulales bacterium]|nr:VWA domain-containing protein [Pirellulales bacterium]
MIVMVAMLALTIDLSYMMSVQSEMDRAVDAAALAGAGELVHGVDRANITALDILLRNPVGSQVLLESQNREALLQAWLAEHQDRFETESGNWDLTTQTFTPTDVLPSAIHITASYEHPTLFFAKIFGLDGFGVSSEAIARYQPRDIVLVLDFSASMSVDCQLRKISEDANGESRRGEIVDNLLQSYINLGSPQYGNMQFDPVYINSNTNDTVKQELGLRYWNGHRWMDVPYPYPSGSWDEYINYVKSSYGFPAKAGYHKKYGYLTLVNFWLEKKFYSWQTPDLWKTCAQPVTAVKDAVGVFMQYIQEVDCDDKVALVIYNSPSEDALIENSLTTDFETVQDIVQHRQAAHYDMWTNIGAGIRKGYEELDSHARTGAKKMIVLMTDGQATKPVNDTYARQFALDQAALAAQRKYPIVTISLGNDADQELMAQIAELTGGVHFNIPGGDSVNDYEDQLLTVFRQIADDRPLLLVK